MKNFKVTMIILLLGMMQVYALAFEKISPLGQISYPKSNEVLNIAVDAVGRIYLAQKGKNKIIIYNKFGSQIDALTLPNSNYFIRGVDFDLDHCGNLILVDINKKLLQKVDPNGKEIFSLGGRVTGGVFRSPQGISIDTQGNIFVSDVGSKMLQVYSEDGIFIGSIESGEEISAKSSNYRMLKREIFTGKPIPKKPVLQFPVKSTVDKDGMVYLLDSTSKYVFIYNSDGEYMGNINLAESSGKGDLHPIDIAVNKENKIIILDGKNHNLLIFSRKGKRLGVIGTKGTGMGQFYQPKGIYFREQTLYVLDAGNNRIQMFQYGNLPKKEKQVEELEVAPRLAIFKLNDANALSQEQKIGHSVSEMLTTAFVNSGKFRILERGEIERVIKELNFDATGMVSEDSAKEVGKVLGVEIGLVGAVSSFENKIDVDVRLLNMKTGVIIQATNLEVSSKNLLREKMSEFVIQLERAYINLVGAPSPPKGLFALPGVRSIFLRWEKNTEEDVLGYNIFRSDSFEGEYKKVGSVSKNEFSVKELSPRGSYYFQVTAFDSEGKESTPCDPIRGEVRQMPDFGYILKVKNKTLPKAVNFEWKNPETEAVKEYQIYRSIYSDRGFKMVGTTQIQKFEEDGLDDGKAYYYKIRKVYLNGMISEFSNSFVCSTDACPQPVVFFQAQSDLPRKVKLEWKPHPDDKDIDGFQLYRSEFPDGEYDLLKVFKFGMKRKYVDKNLNDNTVYYYKIKVLDKANLESPLSVEVLATTKDVPPTPLNISGESGLPQRIKIKWNLIPGRNDILYKVYRSESYNGEFAEIGNTRKGYFVDERLPHFSKYYYFVTAKDKDKLTSKPSDIVNARTKSLPRAPSGIKTIDRSPRKATVMWDKNPEPDISYYNIYFSKSHKGKYKKVGETEKTHFTYKGGKRGLSDNTTYWFRVSAIDSDKLESIPSEDVQTTTKALPLKPLTPVIEFKDKTVVMSWNPVAGDDIFGYAVFKNRKKIKVVKSNLFVDENIKLGRSYTYEVAAVDLDELMGPKSDKVKIKIPKRKR